MSGQGIQKPGIEGATGCVSVCASVHMLQGIWEPAVCVAKRLRDFFVQVPATGDTRRSEPVTRQMECLRAAAGGICTVSIFAFLAQAFILISQMGKQDVGAGTDGDCMRAVFWSVYLTGSVWVQVHLHLFLKKLTQPQCCGN